MEKFDSRVRADAHRAFEEWSRQHPNGFVLNHRSVGQGMLHKADCLHLTFDPTDQVDLARQPKWCSENEGELLDHASESTLSVLRCQTCMT